MVGTLIPIGYGESRWSRAPLPLLVYVAASVAAGGAVGAALGAVGSFGLDGGPGAGATGAVVGSLALGYSFREARLLSVPIPQLNRQVRQRRALGQSRPRLLALYYGAGLGAGILTHITTATLVIVVAAIVMSGDAGWGAFAMAAFGLARSAPLLLVGREAATDERSLVAATDAIFKWEEVVHLTNGLTLAFAAAAFLSWSVNP